MSNLNGMRISCSSFVGRFFIFGELHPKMKYTPQWRIHNRYATL